MDIGFMGLGRMGENMVRRLLRGGHRVVAWNRSKGKIDEVAKEGKCAAALGFPHQVARTALADAALRGSDAA